MNRRHFLRTAAIAGASASVLRAGDQRAPAPIPSPAALAWLDAELVAMYHFDLHLFDAPGEKHVRYHQPKNRIRKFANTDAFAPDAIDVDQWVASAADMGAKAAVMTACHENGLRLWRSDANPFSLKTTKWGDGKRDLVDEFAKACRKRNILPGFFHCQRWNSLLRIHDYRPMPDSPMTQAQYYRMIEKEVEELCTRYGDLFMLWFDGGGLTPDQGGADILPIFEKHQPGAIYYHSDQRRDVRWAGNENGVSATECSSNIDLSKIRTKNISPLSYWGSGDPDGPDFCPALADTPLRGKGGHEWFWEPGDERLILPPETLLEKYEKSVGRNASLVIGLTPDKHGLLPEADVKTVKTFGDLVRKRYGTPLASTSGAGETLVLRLPTDARTDRVVIGEVIATGERVRGFVIEERLSDDGEWKPLAKGKVIGHRRIEKFAAGNRVALRLRITASAGTPKIAVFSAFAA